MTKEIVDKQEPEYWVSWDDFLGYEQIKLLPFREAREIAWSLGIKGKEEYQRHTQGKLPKGMPSNPNVVYAKDRLTSD